VFRRSKPESAPAAVSVTEATSSAGKGRPTPTRKEAEAAARARAKAALDPKASKRAQRQYRAERSREIRQGIKVGDERYLPARDQGPVKAFVRDYVDTRLNMAEFAIPLLFASLLFSTAGMPGAGAALMNALMIVVVFDCVLLRWRMRRELRRRFPDESLKGTTFYAYMRALQLRFLRLPKPRVKLGQPLPDRY
jgi:Flp pilus assembly protein TadB